MCESSALRPAGEVEASSEFFPVYVFYHMCGFNITVCPVLAFPASADAIKLWHDCNGWIVVCHSDTQQAWSTHYPWVVSKFSALPYMHFGVCLRLFF